MIQTLKKQEMILLFALNAVLVFIVYFGLYGNVWLYDFISNQRQLVPLLGSQTYLQQVRNIYSEATISYSLLSYTIIYPNGTAGLWTFDWAQFFLFVLIVFDIMTSIHFLKSWAKEAR